MMGITSKQIWRVYCLLLSLGSRAVAQLQTTGTRVARVHACRVPQDVAGLLDQEGIEPQARAALQYQFNEGPPQG